MMCSSMNGSNGENTSTLQSFAATILQHHQQQQQIAQSQQPQQPTKPTMDLLYFSALKNGTHDPTPPIPNYGNGAAVPISTFMNKCSSDHPSQLGNFHSLFPHMLQQRLLVPDSISLRNPHESQHQQQWLMMQYLIYASRLMASGDASNSNAVNDFRENGAYESHRIHRNCDANSDNKNVDNDEELEVGFAVDDHNLVHRHSSPTAPTRTGEATNESTQKQRGAVRQAECDEDDQPSTSIVHQAGVEEEENELNKNGCQSDCLKGLNEESDRKQLDDIVVQMNPAEVAGEKVERSKSTTPDEGAWKRLNKNHRRRRN